MNNRPKPNPGCDLNKMADWKSRCPCWAKSQHDVMFAVRHLVSLVDQFRRQISTGLTTDDKAEK